MGHCDWPVHYGQLRRPSAWLGRSDPSHLPLSRLEPMGQHPGRPHLRLWHGTCGQLWLWRIGTLRRRRYPRLHHCAGDGHFRLYDDCRPLGLSAHLALRRRQCRPYPAKHCICAVPPVRTVPSLDRDGHWIFHLCPRRGQSVGFAKP